VHGLFAVLNLQPRAAAALARARLQSPRACTACAGVHSSEQNLGVVFTLWDRLRGTLALGDASPDARLGVG
jgi:hypothetical protein